MVEFNSSNLDLYQSNNIDVILEGQLSPENFQTEECYNTLDEPIKETILRDVKTVGKKVYQVFYPVENQNVLKEWDLWGPLILCTFMAIMLQDYNDSNNGGPEFAEVFVVFWLGSMVVTLNTKLLGGSISVFQSVCVLGYCLLPSCLSLIACKIFLFATPNLVSFILRIVSVVLGLIWATYTSIKFLGGCQTEKKQFLVAFPMFLFYLVIGWMVISHSNP